MLKNSSDTQEEIWQLIIQGHCHDAFKLIDEALVSDPDNDELHRLRNAARNKWQKELEARLAFKKVMEIDFHDVEFLTWLGFFFAREEGKAIMHCRPLARPCK